MKKIISYLLVFALGVMFTGCSEEAQYERGMKKTVKTYLKKNLKDPDSLKDLKITYAILTQDEADLVYTLQLWAYEANPKKEICPSQWITINNQAILLLEYRAKNSYGAYVQAKRVYTYYPFRDEKFTKIRELPDEYLYLAAAVLSSPNKKVLE